MTKKNGNIDIEFSKKILGGLLIVFFTELYKESQMAEKHFFCWSEDLRDFFKEKTDG